MFPRRDAFGKSVYILTVSRQNIGEAGSTIASSWDIFLRLRVGSNDQDGEPGIHRDNNWYACTIALGGTVEHHRVMKRTVVWLTDKQSEALSKMSKKSLAPVSALVRQAVKEFLQAKRNNRTYRASRV
jgi:hypothetical protein